MSDPGLSHRLRQRSRRAGLMIGISMVLTIALCAVGFTIIYTALDQFTSDFVSQSDVTPTEVEQVAEANSGETEEAPTPTPDQSNNESSADGNEATTPEPTPAPTPTPGSGNEGNDNEDEFDPDYQLANYSVNLREGPSTSTSIITALSPATPLQYMNEDAPTDDPSDGERWMMFSTEDGLEGWIREIDVTEYEP